MIKKSGLLLISEHGFKTSKQIVSARAYIAAAGLYELHINGQRIGDHRLDPMFTRFDRRLLYVTYDITQYLQQGSNAAGVLLGNGWYQSPAHSRLEFSSCTLESATSILYGHQGHLPGWIC